MERADVRERVLGAFLSVYNKERYTYDRYKYPYAKRVEEVYTIDVGWNDVKVTLEFIKDGDQVRVRIQEFADTGPCASEKITIKRKDMWDGIDRIKEMFENYKRGCS